MIRNGKRRWFMALGGSVEPVAECEAASWITDVRLKLINGVIVTAANQVDAMIDLGLQHSHC